MYFILDNRKMESHTKQISLLIYALHDVIGDKRASIAWITERYGTDAIERFRMANYRIPGNLPSKTRFTASDCQLLSKESILALRFF